MKSVLISIQPKWCELIASGKKTIEVRKTKPKLDVPFKCYIYCTANKHGVNNLLEVHGTDGKIRKANGKVIGEFVCREITVAEVGGYCMLPQKKTLIDPLDLMDYANDKTLYGWHISDLVMYDKPRELRWLYPNMTDEEIAEKLERIQAQGQVNTDMALERILQGQ